MTLPSRIFSRLALGIAALVAALTVLYFTLSSHSLWISHQASSTVQRFTQKLASSNCDSVLIEGRYIDNAGPIASNWQPNGCVLKRYTDADDITACMRPGDEIILFGDSTARQSMYFFLLH